MYLNTIQILTELFIPRQERIIGGDGTRTYIHLSAIHQSPFDFPAEKFIGQKCMYGWSDGKQASAILLYPEKVWEWFPLDIALGAIRTGKQHLQALSGSGLKFGNQSAGEVDFAQKKMGTKAKALILEYLLFHEDRRLTFYIYVTDNALSEMLDHIAPRIGSHKVIETLIREVSEGIIGARLFPWRFPQWMTYLSQPEREKVINQLLGKKRVDFRMTAELITFFPQLREMFESSLSQSNKIQLQRSFREIPPVPEIEAETLLRKWRIAAGELFRHEEIILPTMDIYHGLLERGNFFMDLETIERKSFDQRVAEIPVTEMEQTVLDLSNRTLATAFVIDDYSPETEETVLDFLSPQGKTIHEQDKEQIKESGIGEWEVFSARLEIINRYLERQAGFAFLIIKGKWLPDIPYEWWLQGVEDSDSMMRLYAAIGYRQWKDLFLGVSDPESMGVAFSALPEDVRISIAEQSARVGEKINPTQEDHSFKARWKIVETLVSMSMRGLIELAPDRSDKIALAAKEGYRIKSGR